MELYVGGYFLVEKAPQQEWMNKSVLPETLLTPSSSICPIHPKDIALGWVHGNDKARAKYRDSLGLSQREYIELQETIDQWFNENKYGWISTFIDLRSAKAFREKYLKNVNNVHLIAVATTQEYMQEFLEEEKPEGNIGESATYIALNQRQSVEESWQLLGWDILGHEMGAFWSFIINSLETDFSEKFNISFNEYGLVDSLETANIAAEYVRDPDIGAEPALWQPWAIYEVLSNG